jgi:hypothetical protein
MLGDPNDHRVKPDADSACTVCGAPIRWLEQRDVEETTLGMAPLVYRQEWHICEQGHEVLRMTKLTR